MSERASCWSFTINNPTQADEEAMALARQQGWKVEGQLEKGENGTQHYQLLLRTPQVRFSAVKKAFPRAHIEIARNPAALASYVTKEESRVAELPQTQDKYPSLSKLWSLIFEFFNEYDPAIISCLESGGWKKDKTALENFDHAIHMLIRDGYHVETMAVNPQIRSAFSKYHAALYFRHKHSQTDRQTDTRSDTAEVNLPVY